MAKHRKPGKKRVVATKKTTMKALVDDAAIRRKADPIAKKAKAAFDRHDVADKRADDLKITGGQLCLEVKEILKGSGIKLDDYLPEHTGRTRAWCADAMTIAAQPDPIAALEKRREGKTASSNKSKAKAKAGRRRPGGEGPKEGASITEVVSTALIKVGENGAKNILQSEAARLGIVMMSKERYDTMAKTPETAGLKAVLAGFDKLSARDMMLVAEHAATKVGCTLVKPAFADMGQGEAMTAADVKDAGEVPAFLKRDGKGPKVTTKAKKRSKQIKGKKETRVVKRGAVA